MPKFDSLTILYFERKYNIKSSSSKIHKQVCSFSNVACGTLGKGFVESSLNSFVDYCKVRTMVMCKTLEVDNSGVASS